MKKNKVIELFTRIEHVVMAISEIDKYAVKAYELLHGEAPNLGDIFKI